MVLTIQNNWVSEIVDVVTAFLYGDLDELIFMTIPEGLDKYQGANFEMDDCVVLEKSIYGLVQAARQFHRKLIDKMTKDMGFSKCLGDECLLFKESAEGVVIVCIYIDDTLCVGDEMAVNRFKTDIKKHFETKEEGAMSEYVGCKVRRTGEKSLIMYQDDLIKKMEKTFNELVKHMQIYDMPAGTGMRVTRSKEGLITKTEQTLYRSGVGMLLFLVKYSRPDLANIVRELSRVNDGATKGHMSMLLRVIKFTFDTKNRVLSYELKNEKGNWELRAFCDSDWAGNKDDRRSITGYCIYLQGCLVAWKSRAQKNVTLSSSEAEYVAISEVCTEIMFIKTVLTFLGVEMKRPIQVNCDNVGAIFLSHNAKASARTKHIDIRYHFIREHVVDGLVEIVFVRSEENDADIFTKNVGKAPYEKHSDKFMKNE